MRMDWILCKFAALLCWIPSSLSLQCLCAKMYLLTPDPFLLHKPPTNWTSIDQSYANPLWYVNDKVNCTALTFPDIVPGLKYDVCLRIYMYYKDLTVDLRVCAYEEEAKGACINTKSTNKTCMLCNFDYCNNSSDPRDYFWLYSRDSSERILPKSHWCFGCLLILILHMSIILQ